MYSRQHMVFLLTFFLLASTISSETLQKDSCCTNKCKGSRSRLIANVDGCICKEASDGYSICYNANNDQNSCKKYPRRIKINTNELTLRSTSIENLLPGDFDGLNHLEKLFIEENLMLNHIHELVFRGMKNLKVLSISSSPLLNSFHADTFRGLMNLKELNVVNCGFNRIQEITIALKINVLPNLRQLNLRGNKFPKLNADDFNYLSDESSNSISQLEELDLTACEITSIAKEALNPLKKLSKVHLGNNSLTSENLVDLLKSAFSSNIPLRYLDLESFGIKGVLPKDLTKVLANSDIDTLNPTNNEFAILGEGSIPTTLPNLRTLDLSNSQPNFLDSSFFTKTPNLEKLILNKHNLSYFTLPRTLPKLRYLDLSEFTKKGYWEFFHLETEVDVTGVEYLDLHSTRLAFLMKDSFKFMPDLKELDLSKCVIAKISTGAFAQLSKLKYLNLEDNKFFIMYIRYPSEPFLGLENLEKLLVGGNSISYISSNGKNLFKHLSNLKCLGLQRNSLEAITSEDFEFLPKLEILDISSNPLYAWDDRVFFKSRLEKFYASSNHFSYLSQAMVEDFSNFTTLDIDYSPFSCDCRMMRRMYPNKFLLREIKESPVYKNLLCAGSHEIKILDFLETTNYADCEPKKSHMMYFFGAFLGIAFLAAIMILFYIVRDQIPYANAFVRSTESRQSIL